MKTAFTGGYVISGKKDCVPIRADVLVNNGKIEKIGKVETAGLRIIDCSGKYIMPGLVNLHAHLFGTGKPSKVLGGGKLQQLLMKLIKTTPGERILDNLVASAVRTELHSGVTTLRSSGDFIGSDIKVRELIKSGKKEGPRLICPGEAITVPTGHGDGTFAKTATDPSKLKKLVYDRYKSGADYIKICVTGGVMDAKKKGAPGEVKMSLAQTKAVCDKAHYYGLKVASHTQSTEGMRVAIMGGVDTIEHGADFDEECQKILRERGGAIVPTFSPAYPLSVLPCETTKLDEMSVYNSQVVIDGMKKGINTAKAAGIRVGLGTDGSCPFATQYGTWRELWYYHKLMDVTAQEAIYTGTLAGAQILGIDGITGSIEEGKSADMMILSENPLDDLTAMREPYRVVFQGKVIKPQIKRIKAVDDILDEICAKL